MLTWVSANLLGVQTGIAGNFALESLRAIREPVLDRIARFRLEWGSLKADARFV